MSVDCQWIEKNLEALFCDGLNQEDSRQARAHIDSCGLCRKEVQALYAVDPLVKKHFQRELGIARRPQAVNKARALGLSGAALAVIAILLFAVVRVPQTRPIPSPLPDQSQVAPPAPVQPPPPIKNDVPSQETGRAKPLAGADRADGLKPFTPVPPSTAANAQDFSITDPAGYTHTAEEYRGHVVVVGMWSADLPEATANLDRLYRAYAANTKLRFLGVSNKRQARPANTTFPIVYNQGSKMFGAEPGGFVVLDEHGSVELRGSLVKDFDTLTRTLRQK